MPLINKRLQNCIDRVDSHFDNFEEGKLTEIGLIDFLDQEVGQFTKRDISWVRMNLKDYFDPQFNASDRILMMYLDARFNAIETIREQLEEKWK